MFLHQASKAQRVETDIPLDSCLYHKNGTFSVFPEKYGFQNRQEQTKLSGSEVLNNSISQTCTLFYAMLVGGGTKHFSCMGNMQATWEKNKNTVFSLRAIISDLLPCTILDSCHSLVHFSSSQETLSWFTDFFFLWNVEPIQTWIRSVNESLDALRKTAGQKQKLDL